MANFYLNPDGCQDMSPGEYTDQVDGTRPLTRYFAVNLKYLGAHVSSNLFCYVKQISDLPAKKEMDNLFMACFIKNGLVKHKDDRVILTMLDIVALATHNLRSLQHYEMILRMLSWGDDTTNVLDKMFVKSDHSTYTIRCSNSFRSSETYEYTRPRSTISHPGTNRSHAPEKMFSYDNARTVLILISCIHFYYSSLWSRLYAEHGSSEFDSDWITASKPVCTKARSRYWDAVRRKGDFDRLASAGPTITEPGPGFTRWRIPKEGSDQWECN